MKTVTMQELYQDIYSKKPPVIEGLLYQGTYLFVGSPKIGKSFFMAQLAYHVSTGTPLWDYPVKKGTVLYLALEDDYRLLQERMYRMFGTDSTENLYFSSFIIIFLFLPFLKKSFVSDDCLLIMLANKSVFSCRISY